MACSVIHQPERPGSVPLRRHRLSASLIGRPASECLLFFAAPLSLWN